MQKIKKEIVVAKPKVNNSVETLISQAITANVPIETLERLMVMRDKVKNEQAKEAFISAMSQFQAKCPIINKNKDVLNKDGKTVRYSYASLDSIVSQVKDILGNCELSYTTQVKNETGFVTAVCKITHVMGHSEESEFKIPVDTEGYMSAPQKYASALTFAKRYAFCNVLGIMTGEDDFDASDVGKKAEIQSVMSTKGKIMFLLKQLDIDTTMEGSVLVEQIKKLTQLELSEDTKVIDEIRSRLEILVIEKRDANS